MFDQMLIVDYIVMFFFGEDFTAHVTFRISENVKFFLYTNIIISRTWCTMKRLKGV
jgi:hypothetical protein